MSQKTSPVSQTPEPDISNKFWLVALFLSIFVGYLGIDRFYIGRTRSGYVKLFTLGALGAWWLSDIVLILADYRKDAQGKRLRPLRA